MEEKTIIINGVKVKANIPDSMLEEDLPFEVEE